MKTGRTQHNSSEILDFKLKIVYGQNQRQS